LRKFKVIVSAAYKWGRTMKRGTTNVSSISCVQHHLILYARMKPLSKQKFAAQFSCLCCMHKKISQVARE